MVLTITSPHSGNLVELLQAVFGFAGFRANQEAVCRAFAVSGGNKFDGVDWTPGVTGSPLIDGSLATVECTLGAIYEGGDHELVTGHVVDMEIGKGSPLIFYRSGFGRFEA